MKEELGRFALKYVREMLGQLSREEDNSGSKTFYDFKV